MSGIIKQTIESKNEDGSGRIVIVATDENGNDHTAVREYNYTGSGYGSSTEAIENATQEALNKC